MDDTIDIVVTKFKSQLKEYFKDCNFLKKKYFKFKKENIDKYNDDYDKINYAFIEYIKNDITYSNCLNKLWFFTDLILFLRLIKKKSRKISSSPDVSKKKLTERFNKIMDILKSFNDDGKTTKDKSSKIKNNFIVLVKKIGKTAIDNPKKAEKMLRGIEEKVYDIKPQKKKRSRKNNNDSTNTDTSGDRTVVKTREGAPELRQQQDRGGRDRNTGNAARSRKGDRDYGDTKEREKRKGKGWSLPSFGFGSSSSSGRSRGGLDFSGDDFKSRGPSSLGSRPSSLGSGLNQNSTHEGNPQKITLTFGMVTKSIGIIIPTYEKHTLVDDEIDVMNETSTLSFKDNNNNKDYVFERKKYGDVFFYDPKGNVPNNSILNFENTYKYLEFKPLTYTFNDCPEQIFYSFIQPDIKTYHDKKYTLDVNYYYSETNKLLFIINENIKNNINESCESLNQLVNLVSQDEFVFEFSENNEKQKIKFKNRNKDILLKKATEKQTNFPGGLNTKQINSNQLGGAGVILLVFFIAILFVSAEVCMYDSPVYDSDSIYYNKKLIQKELISNAKYKKELQYYIDISFNIYKTTAQSMFGNSPTYKKFKNKEIFIYNKHTDEQIWINSSDIDKYKNNNNFYIYESDHNYWSDEIVLEVKITRNIYLYINDQNILYFIKKKYFRILEIPRGAKIISITANETTNVDLKPYKVKLPKSSDIQIKFKLLNLEKDEYDKVTQNKPLVSNGLSKKGDPKFLRGGFSNTHDTGDDDNDDDDDDDDETLSNTNIIDEFKKKENKILFSITCMPLILDETSKSTLDRIFLTQNKKEISLSLTLVQKPNQQLNKLTNILKEIKFTYSRDISEQHTAIESYYTHNICTEFPPPPPLSLLPNCD